MLNFTFKKYAAALISVFLITVIFMSLFSIAMSIADINDPVSKAIINNTKYFSALLAGCFCAYGGKRHGFLTGGLGAVCYISVLYAGGLLLFGFNSPGIELIKQFAAVFLCGCAGGIIGINLKKN